MHIAQMFPQSTGFGMQPQTGFGGSTGFGTSTTQFNPQPTGFGYGTSQPGFGTYSTFGYPATGFGTMAAPTFYQPAATGFNTAATGFGYPQPGFGNTGFGTGQTGFGATGTGFNTFNTYNPYQPAGINQYNTGFRPNQYNAFGASGVQNQQYIQTQAVPTCVACNARYYVGGLADGVLYVINKSQPQSPQHLNVGKPIISLDIYEDEAALGTANGLILVNLQQGAMRQITAYNLPVVCVKYVNAEYVVASFLAADGSNQLKRKRQTQSTSSISSRWNAPAQAAPQDLPCYELQIIELKTGSIVASSSKEMACSGLFALAQEANTGYSYNNTALARVYVPGVQGYEYYAVASFYIKKTGASAPRFDSAVNIQYNPQQQTSGVSAIACGNNQIAVAYENGELCVFKNNSSSYSSYRNYANNGAFMQAMGCRVNALFFYPKTYEFLVALQRGQLCTLKDDGSYGVVVKQAQGEIACVCIDSTSAVAIIGVGNVQQVLDSKQGQFITFGVNEINGKIQQGS